jgi:hypothetical protein
MNWCVAANVERGYFPKLRLCEEAVFYVLVANQLSWLPDRQHYGFGGWERAYRQ